MLFRLYLGVNQSLANCLIQLLNDNELQNKMGKAGREKFENEFTFEKFQNRLEKVLSES